MSASHPHRFRSSLLGVVAVGAILVGVNAAVDTQTSNVQLDLTQQHLYTLAPGTRQILADIKEPITLRLFYSRALGTRVSVYGAYADRVRELLEQYARLAGGKLKLEFYDPEPFSETEDRATAYGLQGVPVDASGEQVFFGLAGTNLVDDEKTIAFFQPERERFLEYDVSKLIYELSNSKRPEVGVMTPLPIDGDPQMAMMRHGAGGPWASMSVLRDSFDIKTIPTTATSIDPDVKVLLVAQPQHLSDATLYAIDQFVMRGGRLMAMVDPHSEFQANTPSATGQPPTDTGSDLTKLFDAWGIAYDPKMVVGDLTGAWRVRGSESDRMQAVDYVAWFNIRDGISHDDPATADLTQVTVASAGALAKKDGSNIEFTPLLSSSNESGLLPVAEVAENPDPAKILAGFKPAGGPRVIAARVRGVLKSAYPAAPAAPAPVQGQPAPPAPPPYVAQTNGPANLVVVADTDILVDRYWVRTQDFFGQQQATPFSDNGSFVAGLVGTLAGGDALIGLRSRGTSMRPFDVVDDMQRRAEASYRTTERQLQTHLDDTEKKLTELRGGGNGPDATAMVTPEQRAAIEDLRHDVSATRGKLRGVQLDLRREIAGLETNLRLFNIVMVPAILAILAVGLGLARRRRRAQARS